MKYLLILTFIYTNGAHYASRFEYDGIMSCNEAGYAETNFLLSHIPDIQSVHWECIKKEYGN